MLKVGGETTVCGDGGPFIFQDHDFVRTDTDHGFDSDDHAGFKPRAAPLLTVIGNLWFFPQAAADTVAT